MMLCVVDTQVV